jgi:hypothetical protein
MEVPSVIQSHESRVRERIGRILSLIGDLLREVGELQQAHRPQSPAAAEDRCEESETATRDQAEAALDQGFSALFAGDPAGAGEAAAAEKPAGAGEPAATEKPIGATEPAGCPPTAESLDSLILVCESDDGTVAVPWNRIAGAELSQDGALETFTVEDRGERQTLGAVRVLGLWTPDEIKEWKGEIRWLSGSRGPGGLPKSGNSPGLQDPPASVPHSEPPVSVASEGMRSGGNSVPEMSQELPADVERSNPPAAGGILKNTPRVWVVSPSALARRFLMRHLAEMGVEVLEARDLEDPLLPADLKGIGGLFLDEILLESWQAHPASTPASPPVVLLTVDGDLRVPPQGALARQGAVLPRPFERSDVERVVGWLRSLWEATRVGGSDDHGNEEDDTWVFADPFGAQGTGKYSGR